MVFQSPPKKSYFSPQKDLFQIFKKSISDPIFWEANVGTEQDPALRPAKFVGAFFSILLVEHLS
jgi:hypothetical protein